MRRKIGTTSATSSTHCICVFCRVNLFTPKGSCKVAERWRFMSVRGLGVTLLQEKHNCSSWRELFRDMVSTGKD